MANELKVKNGLIVQGPLTASFAYTTASWALNALSSTQAQFATQSLYATQSLFSTQSVFASSSLVAVSSSWASSSLTSISSSYAGTASVLLGSVTSASYATSASNAQTASFSITSSNLIGWNFINTGSVLASLNTQSLVISLSTGSYLAAFFDYAAVSASNIRAGTVFGSWVNGSVTYTEITDVDVGDTSQVTMSLGLSGSIIQLSASISTTTPWTIKSLARFI